MSACRRDTFGDSNTILLAGVRPSEQLPWIGWRLPSAVSSQAPSSSDAFTQILYQEIMVNAKMLGWRGEFQRTPMTQKRRRRACLEHVEGSSALQGLNFPL